MKLIWTLMIWSCVTTQVSVGKPDPNAIQLGSTCVNGYEKVTNSTMCARDSLTYIEGSSGVRRKDIARILELHNYHRARVVPTATNMMKMYWDDELAKIAEKWAKQCVVGHESSLEMSRYIPAYGMYPGQNGAFGYASWDGAVEGWYQEVNKYRYGQDPAKYLGPEGWREIGHYTQLATASSVLIGCGFARCQSSYKNHYFCNYLVSQRSFSRPYNEGRSCANCPNSCVGGKLCDCRNKFCFNKGFLDINTCQCRCKEPWFGPRCLRHPCPSVTCENGGALNADDCSCSCVHPFVGDRCEIDPCPGLKCQNDGKIISENCTCSCVYPFSGEACETLSCGSRLDPYYCGTVWPRSFCNKFGNVKKDCAIMCGLCSAPCGGKSCQNNGLLNPDTCQCSCKKPFTGNLCEIKKCPKADPEYCGTQWSKNFCNKFDNVPEDCPYMCGICDAHCSGKKCLNNGKLDIDTCKCECEAGYIGTACQTEVCRGIVCQNGGSVNFRTCRCSCTNMYTGSYCEKRRCPGITCQNGGTLTNFQSCKCSCPPFYTGDRCEVKPAIGRRTVIERRKLKSNCPSKDEWYCGSVWPPDVCRLYANGRKKCPIMCGICKAPCSGKTCRNDGELNVKTCGCECVPGFTGERCEGELCSGRKCQNGGQMDFRSCKCSCSKLYSGDLCQKKNCPTTEPFYCGTEWKVDFCKKYINVPDECPFMCGVCKPPCRGKKCLNNGRLDVDSCRCECDDRYTGDKCQREKCPRADCKNGGVLDFKTCTCSCPKLYSGKFCQTINCPKSEPFYCGTQWPVNFCSQFSNVPEECPIMCGLCKAPCKGKKCLNNGVLDVDSCKCNCESRYKGSVCQTERCPGRKCQNGGKMDFSTCKCSCTKLYQGNWCSRKVCPKEDPYYCGKEWPVSFCQQFGNVPEDCPYMCGLCKNS